MWQNTDTSVAKFREDLFIVFYLRKVANRQTDRQTPCIRLNK